ncbi:MAG: glycosyltransferase family 2 protein [bacterium]|nr:glycosyltransferase family 2 protein [bacterium]
MRISVVVLTKNEEKNIEECVKSLKWCDEIIVIDDFSKDRTVDIAHKLGAKVYQRKLAEDFASQRNFGLDKANGEWALFIDADERVNKWLRKDINNFLNNQTPFNSKDIKGFYIRREDVMWNRILEHGESGSSKFVRLGRKGSGKWKRRVHEVWDIKGKIHPHPLDPIEHYPHPTLREFISDIEKYSTLHAEENYKEGKRSNLFKIIWYPKLKFFQNYFLKFGFLDGPQGFIVAMVMSFHSYLAWSKLWTIQRVIASERK